MCGNWTCLVLFSTYGGVTSSCPFLLLRLLLPLLRPSPSAISFSLLFLSFAVGYEFPILGCRYPPLYPSIHPLIHTDPLNNPDKPPSQHAKASRDAQAECQVSFAVLFDSTQHHKQVFDVFGQCSTRDWAQRMGKSQVFLR